MSLLVSKLDGKTKAKYWLLEAIARGWSSHSEVFVFEPFSFDVCPKYGLASLNEDKDGDQSILFPPNQLDDDVEIFEEFLHQQCS